MSQFITYLFLALAIIACVLGSSLLTASDGMRRKGIGIAGALIFALSYVFLSRSILVMNVSIAYAIACGFGIILSALISRFIFGQKMTKIGVACMILILLACIYIHMFGNM